MFGLIREMLGHMTKPERSLIGLLLIGVAVVPWLMQRQADIKTINSLQTQLDQLTRQRAEDESSSHRMAKAASTTPNEQLNELLRLRGEVNLLRKQTNELSRLRAENNRHSSDPAARPPGQPNLAAGDSVPIESLTFAGYATPEATFQSTLSAMMKGDLKTVLEGLEGEFRENEEKQFAGKYDTELAALAAEQTARFANTTVKIVASGLLSEDQARLVIFLSADENESFVRMRKIDGKWKITSVNH